MDEEVRNLARRGAAGWKKVGFIARDDLINERKSIVMGESKSEGMRSYPRPPSGDLARVNPHRDLPPVRRVPRCEAEATAQRIYSQPSS